MVFSARAHAQQPIGRRKNDALAELTLPEVANIFASKYQLYLPSKQVLKAELERIAEDLEREGGV